MSSGTYVVNWSGKPAGASKRLKEISAVPPATAMVLVLASGAGAFGSTAASMAGAPDGARSGAAAPPAERPTVPPDGASPAPHAARPASSASAGRARKRVVAVITSTSPSLAAGCGARGSAGLPGGGAAGSLVQRAAGKGARAPAPEGRRRGSRRLPGGAVACPGRGRQQPGRQRRAQQEERPRRPRLDGHHGEDRDPDRHAGAQ